uniref:Ig-like domain-containing protein n=1 Tax=Astatotilapia calliptera TaxID=8154 RepID=A0A3P8NXS1_ASTCA
VPKFNNLFFRYIFWQLHFNILSFILFFVGSVSSPVIELTNVKNEMVLECKSNGWYPEPQMLWVYSEGKPISVEPTKNVRGSDGLYAVSSKVTVEKGQSYSFTCDLFMVQSNTAVHITINLAVCLISVGTAVILIWKCGQKKTSKFKLHLEYRPPSTSRRTPGCHNHLLNV